MQFISMPQYFVLNNEKINKCPGNERLSSTSSSSTSSSEETGKAPKLDITFTNRGFQLYGTLSKRELLKLLKHKLERCIRVQIYSPEKIIYDTTSNERLWITISSGLYSTNVLKKLQKNGISIHTIIKAMKLGLISLSYCELSYFKDFNVDPYIMEFKEMWSTKLDDELILNLTPTGLTELECWNVIMYGVAIQKSRILCHLMLSGIDIPGILTWQSPIKIVLPEIIQFLKYLGIDEGIIQVVKQFGIDEETEQMLIDIGFHEMKEQFSNMEEVVCGTKLTVESDTSSSRETQDICKTNNLKAISSSTDTSSDFQLNSCQCHLAKNKTAAELTAQRNDYLRQNIMVPLAWAMARTLSYNPTDPIHYTAYQLLRWPHISETEKDSLQELIALDTIKMDRKLIENKCLEELIRNSNEKNVQNTVCKSPQQFKQKHCKCKREPVEKYETCEFPEVCSSCKINVSNSSGFSHLQH
nr:PREDICTED: uncharacterized protein LOC105662038 [Megachile rotundata]